MILSKLGNLDPSTRTRAGTALLFLLAAGLAYFFILPSIKAIEALKNDIVTEKIEQEKRLNREKNYATMGTKLKEVEPRLDRLDEVYISANRKLEFITAMEGAANESGIEQKLNLDLKFSVDGEVKKVPLLIEASGPLEGLLSYLSALESTPNYINIASFDLNLASPARAEGETDRYNLRLTANTYWQ